MLLTLLLQFFHPAETHAIPPLIIAGILAAHAIRTGIQDKQEADRNIKELEGNKPEGYKITPEQQSAYDRAQAMSHSGFTGAQKAAFMGNLAAQNNQQYSRAFAQGGNTLAGAVRAGINYGNSNALNQFAAADSAQQLNNIRYADSLGAGISTQRNRDTSQQLGEYGQKMQNFGMASRDARLRQENAINFFGAMAANSGGGQTARAATPTTTPQFSGVSAPYSGPPSQGAMNGSIGTGIGPVSGMDYNNPNYGLPKDNDFMRTYSLYR